MKKFLKITVLAGLAGLVLVKLFEEKK